MYLGIAPKERDKKRQVLIEKGADEIFKEIIKAIYVSFLFMGIVVFWYFGTDIKLKINREQVEEFNCWTGSVQLYSKYLSHNGFGNNCFPQYVSISAPTPE